VAAGVARLVYWVTPDEEQPMKLSARNQLAGTVVSIN
jgi:hypothetical protein